MANAKQRARWTTRACHTTAGATAKAMHPHTTKARPFTFHRSASSSTARAMATVLAAKKMAGSTSEREASRLQAMSQRPRRMFQFRLVAQSSPSQRPSGPV